ncbi:MAG: ribose-phosphate diphosphokinase, partial [Candidatus Woesearchaeota archaeon]|nr:ribose-phosphate diphosphokinase [Candidatus Woesearchaeota archaeon]
QGAKKIVLMIPYLGFMRQDKQFHSGESISSQCMGFLLSKVADKIVTIDPHLHRYKSLSQVFNIPAVRVSAVSVLAQHIKLHWPGAIIMGPDGESNQWANKVASLAECESVVVKKKRYTANKVRTRVKDGDFKNKTVVIVDDIISTGHTMHEVVKQLLVMGAAKVICMGVHGVFATGALTLLHHAGAQVITTDTITNSTSCLSVATLLAETIK